MDRTVVLFILRHGLTDANQYKQYLGWRDVPLAEEGKQQLNNLKGSLPEVERVFTSDLKRCKETVDCLYPDQLSIELEGLREYNFGAWDGKTYEELKHEETYQCWINEPCSITPPDGERYRSFQERVKSTFEEIAAWTNNQKINQAAVITHGGPLREWLTQLAGASLWNWHCLPGEGYRVKLKFTEGGGSPWTLLQAEPITEKKSG